MWVALYLLFKAAVGLFLFVLAVVVLLFLTLLLLAPRWIKQALCKHVDYWENRSCDAVCTRCGKNLGFIAEVRRRKKS